MILNRYQYSNYFINLNIDYNPHFVARYLNYLEMCDEYNLENADIVYYEQHHILPKADDMFPQYSNLIQFPWNAIYLTTKQHIFAHILLSKAFPRTRSTIATVHYMLNVQNSDTIDSNRREIPNFVKAIYAAKAKDAYYESRKGFGTWKHPATGVIEFLHRDDPKIKELGLIWIQSGTTHSESAKQKMSYTKFFNRKIKLYMLDISRKVKLFSNEYDEHIAQGWTPIKTEFDSQYIKDAGYAKSSLSLSGRSDYMYPDGTYYGKLYKNDPAIQTYNLIYHMTENRVLSALNRLKCAVEFNTDSKWYNNGVINKKFKTDPGLSWVLGAINITEEAKKARADGCKKSRTNKICYNDGKNNFYYSKDDIIPDNLSTGMAPQKKRSVTNKNSGYSIWNDGIQNYRVYDGQLPDSTWVSGKVKQTLKK